MRAYVGLFLADRALGITEVRRMVSRSDAAGPTGGPIGPDAIDRARRYACWIEVAARHHVVAARCLHRSLVLHRWLRRDGLPSTLRIGVRTEDGTLTAHAWVELGGHVVNDAPAAVARFAQLSGPMAEPSETGRTTGATMARREPGSASWKSAWK